jgi:hypothetical protein
MDAQPLNAPRRLRTVFRVLSLVSSLEGAFGLFLTAIMMLVFPFAKSGLENVVTHSDSHSTLLLYMMALTNAAFDVALLIAGALLWKLQRRGLFLLVCTLLAEAAYFLGIVAIEMHFGLKRGTGPSAFSETLGAMAGVGNISLGVQLATGFPIVAGILIFFAYRYLGIPARPIK